MPRPLLRRSARVAAEPLQQPTVLVMTMVRDEAEMLPRWLRHYGAQVGMENLVVLDDNSVDGSTDGLECTVHRLPDLPGGRYENARMTLTSGLAAGFLAAYDFVVFVDADEFLVPDPDRYADLPSFLATRRHRDVIAPMGLNVVHVPSVEPPLVAGEPVLGQRRFAKFTPLMCKPSVKQVPATWRRASHGIEAPFEVDDELFMFHLKFADRDALLRVAAHRRALVLSDGRANASSWSRSAEEVVAALDEAVRDVDLDLVPEFDAKEVDLTTIVHEEKGFHRSVGAGQLGSLRRQPLRLVPSRFLGTI
jgi:Glycosyl transferase family 2